MAWKTLIALLAIALTGCATDKSKTINEYLYRTSHLQKDGSRVYDEYAIRIFWLHNIIASTSWPDGKKKNIQLCVIGENFPREILSKMAYLIEKEKGYKWNIKMGISESDVKHCDVLFAHFMYVEKKLQGFLSVASHYPVLTVGGDERFKYYGGMIAFKILAAGEFANLTIDINMDAVKKAGLSLNSNFIQNTNN